MRLPTVFDALRTAGGVTPFSKLNEVSVTRKRPASSGGGNMRAKLNILELVTDGNESQNIRLFDGDSVVVARSPVELREQIIKAGQTNLSPDFVQVYVTGRVRDPGAKAAPAVLDQVYDCRRSKATRGRVEFIASTATGVLTNASSLSGSSSRLVQKSNPHGR